LEVRLPQQELVMYMGELADELRKSGMVFESSLEVITSAKVPIVKFVEEQSQFAIDLSFNMESGLNAAEKMKYFADKFPALRLDCIVQCAMHSSLTRAPLLPS
jgi:non-canonical poly(A) RNA polymerase PAPD5/7